MMKIQIIKTEQEYNEACARIYSLINSSEDPIELDSPEGKELDFLAILVEKYEQDNPY